MCLEPVRVVKEGIRDQKQLAAGPQYPCGFRNEELCDIKANIVSPVKRWIRYHRVHCLIRNGARSEAQLHWGCREAICRERAMRRSDSTRWYVGRHDSGAFTQGSQPDQARAASQVQDLGARSDVHASDQGRCPRIEPVVRKHTHAPD